MLPRVLLVDDDADTCELLGRLLERDGAEVSTACDVDEATAFLEAQPFDVVLTDLALGAASGITVCERVAAIQPEVPVIVVTAHGTVSSAVSALRARVYDFITKPVDPVILALSVARAVAYRRLYLELHTLKQRLVGEPNSGSFIGECAPMIEVYSLIERVRDTATSVLISGESGTGKELVALSLHTGSVRAPGPFVAVNCAAVPAPLLESELFGHAKGAFTDARNNRAGLFQQASGGTLFLDEIGETSLEMQVKLLRVLQERTVRPVGSNVEVEVDVRIIAATNRDLELEVEQHRFREDLYYRLNVIQINVPPLRARGNDILLLAEHFRALMVQRLGHGPTAINHETARLLLDYDWPGNVRQLQNCMERAVTLCALDTIFPNDLPEKIRKYVTPHRAAEELDVHGVVPLEAMERRYIERVLALTSGNKSEAARLLGVDRRTLYRKLDRFQEVGEASDEQANGLSGKQGELGPESSGRKRSVPPSCSYFPPGSSG